MSGADLLSVCIYGLMTIALGWGFLRFFSAPPLLRKGASAFLAGQLLWLLLFHVAAWVGVPGKGMVAGVGGVALLAGAVGVWRERQCVPDVLRAIVLLLLVCVACFPHVVFSACHIPLIEWDARSVWFFHGKAIWVHGGITSDYFSNAQYSWSHLDYPLLIPVQTAVVGMVRGAWSEMAVKGFLAFNFMAYIALLHRILVFRGWASHLAWMAAVLVLGVAAPQYVNGYADNHYALPLALAALLAFNPRAAVGGGVLAVLLVGAAINSKNEALPYAVLGAVLWGCLTIYRTGVPHVKVTAQRLRLNAGAVLFLAVAPVLLWTIFKAVHDIEGDLHLSRLVTDPVASLSMILQRVPIVLGTMRVVYAAHYAHVVLGMVLVLTLWEHLLASRSDRGALHLLSVEEQVLWTIFVLAHLLVLLVYGLTPYDVNWHLVTSLDRVLIFPFLMLGILLLCAGEKMLLRENFR